MGNVLLRPRGRSRIRVIVGAILAGLLFISTISFVPRPPTLLQILGLLPGVLFIGSYAGYFVRLLLLGSASGLILGLIVAGIRGEQYLESISTVVLLTTFLVPVLRDVIGTERLPHWLRPIPDLQSKRLRLLTFPTALCYHEDAIRAESTPRQMSALSSTLRIAHQRRARSPTERRRGDDARIRNTRF